MKKKVLGMILCVPFAMACSRQTASEETSEKMMLTDSLRRVVSVDTVCMAPFQDELLLNGRVTFDEGRVAEVYPMFSGTVTKVYAEMGDYVRKGQVLAVIQSSEVADFEQQRTEAVHRQAVADRNLDAVCGMVKAGTASERDRLQAEQEAAAAQAEVAKLQEVYSLYHIRSGISYEVMSPVSGFIVNKKVIPHMQLRADHGESLFTVSGLDNVWVMADVYEGDIRRVYEGAGVRITTLAYGTDKVFGGKISKVYNVLDNDSKTMKVRVDLDNRDYLLKPGMFTNVYVECRDEGKRMLRVPSHALVFENGKQYVVCVEADGLLVVRPVEVCRQTDRYCYLNGGVKEGEQVIDKNVLLVYNVLK